MVLRAMDKTAPDPALPGVIAPPPILTLVALAVGIAFQALAPLKSPAIVSGWPLYVIGGLLLSSAIALIALAVRGMRHAGTPVQTSKETKELATSGIFSRTRNPIYVGMILFVCGCGALLANVWLLVAAVLLSLALHFGVVKREEAYLRTKFGEAYLQYMKRTPRYLPRA
jgi:protein-S-isoprenylcysteine O-methyltransferase Ste14